MDMNKFTQDLLQQALHIESDITLFNSTTPLLGNLAELDSIGVVNVITLIEEQLNCIIEDDEINAEVFETFGSLVSFIQGKQSV
ncbi:MAG: phosphopantetheine-binding protein [Methylococcales bacterium]|nr:phosphopantetheine-binding protein [Methylococcales bacterium]